MYTMPNHISLDPGVCIVNGKFNQPKTNESPTPAKYNLFPELEDFINSKGKYAHTMNIYMNLHINRALGGINNLRPYIDEITNTIHIVDTTKIPGQGDQKGNYSFNIFGYNKTFNDSNFVKNIQLKTEVNNNYASMLTIGAAAEGGVGGVQQSAFKGWNRGLTDRFNQEVLDGSMTSSFSTEMENLESTYTIPVSHYLTFAKNFNTVYFSNAFENASKQVEVGTNFFDFLIASSSISDDHRKLASPSPGFLPIQLSVDMDGMSGMKLFQKVHVDTEFLPKSYSNRIDFIVKGISHTIAEDKWETTLSCLSIPKKPISLEYPIQISAEFAAAKDESKPLSPGVVVMLPPLDLSGYVLSFPDGRSKIGATFSYPLNTKDYYPEIKSPMAPRPSFNTAGGLQGSSNHQGYDMGVLSFFDVWKNYSGYFNEKNSDGSAKLISFDKKNVSNGSLVAEEKLRALNIEVFEKIKTQSEMSQPVFSTLNGTVKAINKDETNSSGRYVWISHEADIPYWDGTSWQVEKGVKIYSEYYHLSYITKWNDRIQSEDFKVGTIVKEGQYIGFSGNTGSSSGKHLHWSITLDEDKPNLGKKGDRLQLVQWVPELFSKFSNQAVSRYTDNEGINSSNSKAIFQDKEKMRDVLRTAYKYLEKLGKTDLISSNIELQTFLTQHPTLGSTVDLHTSPKGPIIQVTNEILKVQAEKLVKRYREALYNSLDLWDFGIAASEFLDPSYLSLYGNLSNIRGLRGANAGDVRTIQNNVYGIGMEIHAFAKKHGWFKNTKFVQRGSYTTIAPILYFRDSDGGTKNTPYGENPNFPNPADYARLTSLPTPNPYFIFDYGYNINTNKINGDNESGDKYEYFFT